MTDIDEPDPDSEPSIPAEPEPADPDADFSMSALDPDGFDPNAVPGETETERRRRKERFDRLVEEAAEDYIEGVKPPKPTLRRLLRGAFVLTTFIVAIYFLVPLLPAFQETGEELVRTSWWLLATLFILMVGVQMAYGELVGTVLRSMGESPPFWLIQRTTVVGTSIGKVLPGGTTVALVLIVSTLRKAGLDTARATAALGSAGMISSVVLVLLLPVGVALALVGGQTGGLVLTAMIAATLVVVAAVFARPALKRIDPVADWIANAAEKFQRGWLRDKVHPDEIKAAIIRGANGVLDLTGDPKLLGKAAGWAAANWLLDFLALVFIAMTLGRPMSLSGLLLAFVLGQLATALPITPGGIGVVEAVMIGYLTATGAPATSATATVLGWRLVSHWLPIPVGLALLFGLGKHAARYAEEGPEPGAAPEPSTG